MKKNILTITLTGGLFVILLASLFAYQWPELLKKYPIQRNVPTETEVDTSDWIAYKSDFSGYSFKVPPTSEVQMGPLVTINDQSAQAVSIILDGTRGYQIVWRMLIHPNPIKKDNIGLFNEVDAGLFSYWGPELSSREVDNLDSITKIKSFYPKDYSMSNITWERIPNGLFWTFELIQNKDNTEFFNRKIQNKVVLVKLNNSDAMASILLDQDDLPQEFNQFIRSFEVRK